MCFVKAGAWEKIIPAWMSFSSEGTEKSKPIVCPLGLWVSFSSEGAENKINRLCARVGASELQLRKYGKIKPTVCPCWD